MRKSLIKKSLAFSVALIMILLMSFSGTAAKPEINTGKTVSLSIVYIENEVPIVGEEFKLYKIADVDNFGKFTVIEPFTSYPVTPKGDTVEAGHDHVQNVDIIAADLYFAGSGCQAAGHNIHSGGFTGAIASNDDNSFHNFLNKERITAKRLSSPLF